MELLLFHKDKTILQKRIKIGKNNVIFFSGLKDNSYNDII